MEELIKNILAFLKEPKEKDLDNEELRNAVCQLASVVMHGELTKIEEIAYAATRLQYTVLKEKQGADIKDGENTFDHKAASYVPGKNINLNWRIPPVSSNEEESSDVVAKIDRKKKIAASIDEKIKGPKGAILVGIKGRGNIMIQEYVILGSFFKEMLLRMVDARVLGKSEIFNFGGVRCSTEKCGHFHRVKRLHDLSLEYEKNGNKFTEAKWREIISVRKVPSDCWVGVNPHAPA